MEHKSVPKSSSRAYEMKAVSESIASTTTTQWQQKKENSNKPSPNDGDSSPLPLPLHEVKERRSLAVSNILKNRLIVSFQERLRALGFENEVKDSSNFARGVLQIIRALHCSPCRHEEVRSMKFTMTNLWFLKLYHNVAYRRFVYVNLMYLVAYPLLESIYVTINFEWQFWDYQDPFVQAAFPLTVVFVDVFVKCMAYGKLAYKPKMEREVLSTYAYFLCATFVLLQIIEYKTCPRASAENREDCNDKYWMNLGFGGLLLRSPVVRPFMLIAKSTHLQHEFLSKLFSLKKVMPVFLSSMAIYAILATVTMIVMGFIMTPSVRADAFGDFREVVTTNSTVDNNNCAVTTTLVNFWEEELDCSFRSLFRTMITIFTSLTFGNYVKIIHFVYPSFGFLREHQKSDLMFLLQVLPRLTAGVMIFFFLIVFAFVVDCIVVAVCVYSFSKYRNRTAGDTATKEVANLESAFSFLCMSTKKPYITKNVWMQTLVASGRNFGLKKDRDFREVSVLIFELMNVNSNEKLNESEFVNACVKGFLGKVTKKFVNNVRADTTSSEVVAVQGYFWRGLSAMFDTVGGNFLWLLYCLSQVIFSLLYCVKLSRLTTEALEGTQNSVTANVFNKNFAELANITEWAGPFSGTHFSESCNASYPPINTTALREISYESVLQDQFKNKYDATDFGSYVAMDSVFLVAAAIECFLRFLALKRRSKNYPTFQKKVIPKTEAFDFNLSLVLAILVLLDKIWGFFGGGSEVGNWSHRIILGIRGFRMFRIFPAAARFRYADHRLLMKGRTSDVVKMKKSDWFGEYIIPNLLSHSWPALDELPLTPAIGSLRQPPQDRFSTFLNELR